MLPDAETPPSMDNLIDTITNIILDSIDKEALFQRILLDIITKHNIEASHIDRHQKLISDDFNLFLNQYGLPKLIEDSLNSAKATTATVQSNELEERRTKLQADFQDITTRHARIEQELLTLNQNWSLSTETQDSDQKNQTSNTPGEDDDVQIIEPDSRLKVATTTEPIVSTWHTLQPGELLIAMQLTIGQQVLYRKGKETWFPGSIFNGPTTTASTNQPVYSIQLGPTSGPITRKSSSDDRPTTMTSPLASIALAESASELNQKYPVGARVVAIYRDDANRFGYYSGIIAEPPSERNNHRYLLFFDDGYTQYSSASEVYRICFQSKENWREASGGSQEFIRRYLAQYPQRPMVRLKAGQLIQAELDGQWIQTTVKQVDASLALLVFSDAHVEWIYRGSTRLEPLYAGMSTSTSSRPSLGSLDQQVEVEYSSTDVSLSTTASSIKRRKARKSATGNVDRRLHSRLTRSTSTNLTISASDDTNSTNHTENRTTRLTFVPSPTKLSPLPTTHQPPTTINDDGSSVLGQQEKSFTPTELECRGCVVPYLDETVTSPKSISYEPHTCGPSCLEKSPSPMDPLQYKGHNPLEIPFRVGWLRHWLSARPSGSGDWIAYTAPCGRQLLTERDLQRFLDRTDCQLTTDLFCFDKQVIINQEFRADKMLTNISDISYGAETIPVPCVNSVDNESPPYIEYIIKPRIAENLSLASPDDNQFVACCDCTDNCRDRSKCACQQLTTEASALTNPSFQVDNQAGYQYRRLDQFHAGGIYECNALCKCDRRCSNRVVQNGLSVKLQVFKTSRKGWGIRAIHAIPKGTFICTYAGEVYDEESAIPKAETCGDEYQADLDYIETVEKDKEDYESSPEDPELKMALALSVLTYEDESKKSDPPPRSPIVLVSSPELARGDDSDEAMACKQPSVGKITIRLDPGNPPASTISSNKSVDSKPPILQTLFDQAASDNPTALEDQPASVRRWSWSARKKTPEPPVSTGRVLAKIKVKPTICKESTAVDSEKAESSSTSTNLSTNDHTQPLTVDGQVIRMPRVKLFRLPDNYSQHQLNRMVRLEAKLIRRRQDRRVRALEREREAAAVKLKQEECSRPIKSSQSSKTTDVKTVAPIKVEIDSSSGSGKSSRRVADDRVKKEKKRDGVVKRSKSESSTWSSRCDKSTKSSNSPSSMTSAKAPNARSPVMLRLRQQSVRKAIRTTNETAADVKHKREASSSISPSSFLPESSVDANQSDATTSGERLVTHHNRRSVSLNANGNRSSSTSKLSSSGRRHPKSRRSQFPLPNSDWMPARSYFGDEHPFIMDAKQKGNLGRYFNHSCNPNVLVQNVFIKTHDPRIPEVAFFAKRNIAAGEEMTWNYGYVPNQVSNKILFCYCGESNCCVRLL